MKQITLKHICLACQGCCRFKEVGSEWAPRLLNEEIGILVKKGLSGKFISQDKKIIAQPSLKKDIFICSLLDEKSNKCRLYRYRPFECRLYPFLINRQGNKTYLALDLNCTFAQKDFTTKKFKEYINYLKAFLSSKPFQALLKANPQLIQNYPGALNLLELKISR